MSSQPPGDVGGCAGPTRSAPLGPLSVNARVVCRSRCVSPATSGRRDRHARPLSQMRALKLKRLISDFPKAAQLETQQRPESRPASPAPMPTRPGPAQPPEHGSAGPGLQLLPAQPPPPPQGKQGAVHSPYTLSHRDQAFGSPRHPLSRQNFSTAPPPTTCCAARPGSRPANGGTSVTCTTPWTHRGTKACSAELPGTSPAPRLPSPRAACTPGHQEAWRLRGRQTGHRDTRSWWETGGGGGSGPCSRRGGLRLSTPFTGLCPTSLAGSQ